MMRMDGDLHEMTDAVMEYVASTGRDYHDAVQMTGRCEDESLALARHLRERGFAANVAQVWMDRVPAALEGHEMAGGHFVTVAENADGDRCRIDLTAAQFPEIGWTGPRCRWG